MRTFHSAIRRAILIGFAGGLVGGLAATLCRSAFGEDCAQRERAILEIPDK